MSYLVRLEGGPLDGIDLASPGPWPLPDRLTAADLVRGGPHQAALRGGAYVKISESQLPADHPGLARGARYRWTET